MLKLLNAALKVRDQFVTAAFRLRQSTSTKHEAISGAFLFARDEGILPERTFPTEQGRTRGQYVRTNLAYIQGAWRTSRHFARWRKDEGQAQQVDGDD